MLLVAWVSVEAQTRPRASRPRDTPTAPVDAGAPAPQIAFAVQAEGGPRHRREVLRMEQAMRRHASVALECYARERLAHPAASGRVEATFFVGAAGQAEELSVEGMPGVPAIAQCVANGLREARLPEIARGRTRFLVVFRFSLATGEPPHPVVLDPHVLWRREPHSMEYLIRGNTLYGAALKEE